MDSLWTNTAPLPGFEPLKGDIKTDVLIIGGGITGLLCGYMLRQNGAECAIVEAGKICSGVTDDTTAKITWQHGLIYDRLIKTFGMEKASMYLEANRDALERYKSLCGGIDCDFEEKDSFVYSLDGREKLERELVAIGKLGAPAELAEELPLPFYTDGAVRVRNQAQFHPLKFARAIAEGLPIYEHTRVLGLSPNGAVTDKGSVTAERIIVATHFPFLNKHGLYFLKLYQHRSYVLALDGASELHGMYLDESGKGLSFRNYRNLLLLGGGSHRTGKTGGGWLSLSGAAREYYPASSEAYRWAAQDCMSLDGVPYIGKYSMNTPKLYVASGFNKWGMTSSMVSAVILTDMLLGRENPNAAVFNPSRSMLHPQLASNAVHAVAGLLTPTAPRCPHLGCALKYNPQEHSWDCSCHGSRFGENGTVIDNPANGDKKGLPSI